MMNTTWSWWMKVFFAERWEIILQHIQKHFGSFLNLNVGMPCYMEYYLLYVESFIALWKVHNVVNFGGYAAILNPFSLFHYFNPFIRTSWCNFFNSSGWLFLHSLYIIILCNRCSIHRCWFLHHVHALVVDCLI